MKNADASVSRCANPECEQEFKRLGEGKLFVQPSGQHDGGLPQKTLWLCPACARQFDLRYDQRHHEYHLVRRRVA